MNSECCLKNAGEKPTPNKSLRSYTGQVCICPHEETLSVIGKKWAILILRIINTSDAAGYNEILTQISGITPKAFGDKLRVLEKCGLIEKRIVSERPFRTEYSLTSEGARVVASLEPFFTTSGSQ